MHRRPKISHALHWSMLLFDWGYVQETHGLCAMQTQVWSNLYVCRYCHHGCQMVGISWKTWEHFDNFYYHLVHIVAICFILWQFGTFVDHLWYFPNFGILYQEKYGNPECHQCSMYCCRFQWVHRANVSFFFKLTFFNFDFVLNGAERIFAVIKCQSSCTYIHTYIRRHSIGLKKKTVWNRQTADTIEI
jgi:hypothetical protein